MGEEVGKEKEYLYSEEEECNKGSDVCQEEWDMPVPGLGEEDLSHLSLTTSKIAESSWGGEKSRILGEEVEEEEQYSEGEEGGQARRCLKRSGICQFLG